MHLQHCQQLMHDVKKIQDVLLRMKLWCCMWRSMLFHTRCLLWGMWCFLCNRKSIASSRTTSSTRLWPTPQISSTPNSVDRSQMKWDNTSDCSNLHSDFLPVWLKSCEMCFSRLSQRLYKAKGVSDRHNYTITSERPEITQAKINAANFSEVGFAYMTQHFFVLFKG